MNRKSLIQKAIKLVLDRQSTTPDVWMNLFGDNPPPDGYTGQVMNICIRDDEKKKIDSLGIY